jgi:hypothetical protein
MYIHKEIKLPGNLSLQYLSHHETTFHTYIVWATSKLPPGVSPGVEKVTHLVGLHSSGKICYFVFVAMLTALCWKTSGYRTFSMSFAYSSQRALRVGWHQWLWRGPHRAVHEWMEKPVDPLQCEKMIAPKVGPLSLQSIFVLVTAFVREWLTVHLGLVITNLWAGAESGHQVPTHNSSFKTLQAKTDNNKSCAIAEAHFGMKIAKQDNWQTNSKLQLCRLQAARVLAGQVLKRHWVSPS